MASYWKITKIFKNLKQTEKVGLTKQMMMMMMNIPTYTYISLRIPNNKQCISDVQIRYAQIVPMQQHPVLVVVLEFNFNLKDVASVIWIPRVFAKM